MCAVLEIWNLGPGQPVSTMAALVAEQHVYDSCAELEHFTGDQKFEICHYSTGVFGQSMISEMYPVMHGSNDKLKLLRCSISNFLAGKHAERRSTMDRIEFISSYMTLLGSYVRISCMLAICLAFFSQMNLMHWHFSLKQCSGIFLRNTWLTTYVGWTCTRKCSAIGKASVRRHCRNLR